MKEIGGYFDLELRKGKAYHPEALALNTGRNALELIIISKKYSKVYLPYFTCDVILEPFEKHGILYDFYSINSDFEPIFDFSNIKIGECFLYTNYFGLKDSYIKLMATYCNNLIIDNTQSFFSMPIDGIPTFYSCRKFFGVPDGAYLYLDNVDVSAFTTDCSESRMSHLVKRIEHGASGGYNDFKNNDSSLIGQPIMQMSNLTKALLGNIDYEHVKKVRRENFMILNSKLKMYNQFEFDLETVKDTAPMVYPFWTQSSNLKEKLINNNIFVATYWPNVLEWCDTNQLECIMTNEVVYLPIDQRYNSNEMHFILSIIK